MRTIDGSVERASKMLDRGVDRVREEMSEAAERAMRETKRAIRRGRHQLERGVHDARDRVREQPGAALGIAFAAGAVVGGLAIASLMRQVRHRA